ncbi:MAG: pilus assembly protein PilP [Nevskiaceae bacterium]
MSPARVLLSGLALLAAGCAQDMGDLEEYALEVKSRTSKNIEPIPQPKPYEPFVYEPGDRRDPFIAMLQSRDSALAGAGGAGAIKPDFNRPREPLEEFPLDALRMVGTITMQQRAFALIRAPDAVVHRVSVGDHVGQNFGKITGISETEVVLMEIIPDGLGGYIQRPASVALTQ